MSPSAVAGNALSARSLSASLSSRLGSKDLALSALQEAYKRRDVQLTEMQVEPAFDVLRDDPRFRTLLSRIGLGY